jgi:hypothetical protein
MANLMTLKLKVDNDSDFTSIEQRARRLVGSSKKNLSLFAWWDSVAKTGGPKEACSDETIACVTSYAVAQGSTYRVHVNDGRYDLFYGSPAGDFEELDKQMVADVHRHTKEAGFDNLQGG